MSGGHFDYQNMRMNEWIDTLKRDNYDTKEMEQLLESVMNILHSYDWFISGDNAERDFKKVYSEELKKIKSIGESTDKTDKENK